MAQLISISLNAETAQLVEKLKAKDIKDIKHCSWKNKLKE